MELQKKVEIRPANALQGYMSDSSDGDLHRSVASGSVAKESSCVYASDGLDKYVKKSDLAKILQVAYELKAKDDASSVTANLDNLVAGSNDGSFSFNPDLVSHATLYRLASHDGISKDYVNRAIKKVSISPEQQLEALAKLNIRVNNNRCVDEIIAKNYAVTLKSVLKSAKPQLNFDAIIKPCWRSNSYDTWYAGNDIYMYLEKPRFNFFKNFLKEKHLLAKFNINSESHSSSIGLYDVDFMEICTNVILSIENKWKHYLNHHTKTFEGEVNSDKFLLS